MPYGDRWRKHTQVFHKFMDTGAVEQYRDMQGHEAIKLLGKFLESPQHFYEDIRTCVSKQFHCEFIVMDFCVCSAIGATVMMVSYGHEGNVIILTLGFVFNDVSPFMTLVADRNDEFIELAESSMNMIKKIVMPGAFLVDIIPWSK